MALKRNKKQSLAIRQSATHPTKAAKLIKAQQQSGPAATPVLSPKAHDHSVLGVVDQDATSTAKMVKEPQQSGLVTASVLSPKAARRDAHGRFLVKQSM